VIGRIGTDLVRIRMVYSIACFHQGMTWAWNQVGAYVSSGTQGINTAVHAYMMWLSASFNCNDPGSGLGGASVLGTNICSRDFFVDDGGGDNVQYDIGDDFDATRSGIDNMDNTSIRGALGDGTVQKYTPATLSW